MHCLPKGELRTPTFSVGWSYECQRLRSLPRQSWDRPVDWLVTEQGVYAPGQPDYLKDKRG